MRRIALAASILALGLAALPAAAAETFVRKTSPHTVEVTIDRLAAAVEKAGARVFARINHAEGAARAGMTLRPTTTLLFGNPLIGTPMMQANGAIGLDLPLRVVAYRDAEDVVHVVYRDVRLMAAEYEVDVPTVAKAAGALDKLTDAAIAAE
ncbi:DUF302 domain-containing protein [Paralimibaculum aggregatum]|uniref:DUF302 domain-containing protein n=1 Tax=Paralimibaculum aggregatum TaxID=3036245 RepID=A0ABQ6LRV3_9RHOB|nr:DUF302 domain-containing protein [Limibaculum sp. NKW23]GMG84186.1 DUF302 domain-containing protein [Limibaculum sp. NKW23]